MERFAREAKTLASLNHPHLAAVYGLEAADVTPSRWSSSRARTSRGPIPLAEALPLATQIAAALEGAHGAGVVHRDLNPANLKVRADGTVKVLDFGFGEGRRPRRRHASTPATGGRDPFPVLDSQFDESAAMLSPDGRWLADVSDVTGTEEVYVRRFNADGRVDATRPIAVVVLNWTADLK